MTYHEIFVSHNKVCCTCGTRKLFISYAFARRFAEKHATKCKETAERYIIRPF